MRETISPSRWRDWPASGTLLMVAIVLAGIIAWGILTFPTVKVLAVGLGMLCIFLAAWKIDVALYCVGFFLVVLQEADTTPGTFFTYLERLNRPNIPSLLEVLFAVIAVAFFIRYFIMQEGRYSFDSMKIPLTLFFVFLFIALANGIMDGTDNIFRKEDFKRFLFPVLFFVTAFNILDTREKIMRLLGICFWLILAKTYLANYYYLKGMGFPYGDYKVAFMESGDQTLIMTVFVVGISLLAERKLEWKSWLFMLWGLAPMLFAMMFSYRRNVMLGVILSLCLLLVLSHMDKKIRLLKVFLVTGLCAFSLMILKPVTNSMSTDVFMKTRIMSVFDSSESSNVAHMNEWKVTVEDTVKHPWFGLGLGSVHSQVPDAGEINQHTVHNALLMLWMKMGLFALLLFIWCFYRYCRFGVTEALHHRDPLLTGLFATVGLWMVAMNVGPSWYYYRESCLIALVMAIVWRLALLGAEAASGVDREAT